MTTKLEIDDTQCVGSGNCELLAPATFQLDDDGVSFVVDENGSEPDLIERAIAECPGMAIRRVGD